MAAYDTNIDVDYSLIYQQYSPPVTTVTPVAATGDSTTVVTTINGNSGQATGPVITLSGGATGYEFDASMGSIVLSVGNAATVRSSISAAKSGVNADITQFTALTGNTGFHAWTGTPDQASHATYSGTASVGYVQAELQGVMDALQQATGLIMALLTALLANGVVET
jgi:flagellin-like hook-associated protein FlgL